MWLKSLKPACFFLLLGDNFFLPIYHAVLYPWSSLNLLGSESGFWGNTLLIRRLFFVIERPPLLITKYCLVPFSKFFRHTSLCMSNVICDDEWYLLSSLQLCHHDCSFPFPFVWTHLFYIFLSLHWFLNSIQSVFIALTWLSSNSFFFSLSFFLNLSHFLKSFTTLLWALFLKINVMLTFFEYVVNYVTKLFICYMK